MKESIATKSTVSLTRNDAQTIFQECTHSETTEAQIYERLMSLIRGFQEGLSTCLQHENELQKSLEVAKCISSMLRKNAQRTGNIRYYYFGMFQTKLDQIQEEVLERQVSTIQQEVSSRKHFASIMQILYIQQMVRQSELSKQLSVDKGNLSREMDRLVLAGFVEERKAGKFRLYNLSAQGRAFYDKHLLLKSWFEPEELTYCQEKNECDYQINGMIQYPEISESVSFQLSVGSVERRALENPLLGLDYIDYRFINPQIDMMEVR